MSTDTVGSLRQRMIEDMNARKLCSGTQRGHIRSCNQFAAFLKRSPEHGDIGGYPPVPAAPCRKRSEHLQSQPHHDRAAVFVSRDAAAVGPCCRDLPHPRAAEDSPGDEPGRDETTSGRRPQPQGPRAAQSSADKIAAAWRRGKRKRRPTPAGRFPKK